ncbi:hypothetical protein J5N97_029861 [Dioscorea zingiberensis]|uniref:Histidine-containing phosphotransfer protein n=1 Tax=Dioscorea zingiberensis TaxID=325984 RepID=A0A9D5BWM1_9LILI|nr:hypothetical protein J5N97_029861 [Dioscorea zingiberensis]
MAPEGEGDERGWEKVTSKKKHRTQSLGNAKAPWLIRMQSRRFSAASEPFKRQPVVEFQQVDAYIHQLKGSSSSVGAQNVKLACVQFRHSLEENGRDGCLQALNMVKREYLHLRAKLETMLQGSLHDTALPIELVDSQAPKVGDESAAMETSTSEASGEETISSHGRTQRRHRPPAWMKDYVDRTRVGIASRDQHGIRSCAWD